MSIDKIYMEPPNDIENPRIKRERRAHSPETGEYGQFVSISPEEQPKPNFPRKPSQRIRRVLDLETGDGKEDFDVNTTPQNMYHTGPVPDPLPTNADVEELQQALKEGVNVVKDSICKSLPGNCQLQGGRKRKRKRRTRKKKGGRFEKLALKIDEFNKRIADLEYINEDTASLIQNINNDINNNIEGYGRDIELNSTAIDNISERLQRLEDAILNMETSERKEETKAYMGGRKRRTKKRKRGKVRSEKKG